MVINRFEKFVQRIPWTGCWIWSGSIHPEGYGRFGYKGKTQKAHRVSYELHRGEIPAGKLICHTCDEPSCVNPNHLFVGTNADNNTDKARKGRAAKKLNAQLAKSMRSDLASGMSLHAAAEKYSVTTAAVVKVKYSRTWKEI